jgi:hypothetical protein
MGNVLLTGCKMGLSVPNFIMMFIMPREAPREGSCGPDQ